MRLREVRKIRKLSQKELAQKVGVAQGYISDLENGRYKPGFDVFIRLGKVLDCSLEYLAGEPDGDSITDAG